MKTMLLDIDSRLEEDMVKKMDACFKSIREDDVKQVIYCIKEHGPERKEDEVAKEIFYQIVLPELKAIGENGCCILQAQLDEKELSVAVDITSDLFLYNREEFIRKDILLFFTMASRILVEAKEQQIHVRLDFPLYNQAEYRRELKKRFSQQKTEK